MSLDAQPTPIQVIRIENSGALQSLAFADFGDVCYDVTQDQDCTYVVNPPSNTNSFQRLILYVRTKNFATKLPPSSPAMAWPRGERPSIGAGSQSGPGHFRIVFESNGSAPIFGDVG